MKFGLATLILLLSSTVFARPNFVQKKISIGTKNVIVELADDEEKRIFGLMKVNKLARDQGMLFIFEQERPLSFWMKDTLIPLSIGFFNSKKILVQILEMKTESVLQQNLPVYKSKVPCRYALEMSAGWYSVNKIKLGSKLNL